MTMGRRFPNILITGTPGTGKTTLCELLVETFSAAASAAAEEEVCAPGNQRQFGFVHVKVGDLVKEQQLFTEWDDQLDVPILDDDMLLDYLEPLMEEDVGGKLVDFHSGEFFPAEWFDLVVVLRVETHVLFDRLKERGFSKAKIDENVQAEIFQIILEEVNNEFNGKVEIWPMPNNTIEEQNQILEKIKRTVEPIFEQQSN